MIRRTLNVRAMVLCLTLLAAFASAQTAPAAPQPVNPHASPEARALLKYLDSISGKYTLSGQHNYPNHIARWTDRAYDLTGKYPAVFGQDFGFQGGEDKDSAEARPALIEEIKRQYQNGAIPTLTWHAVRPSSDEPATFRENIQSDLTDFEWNELLTPGTNLNQRWRAQVDVIAGFLAQLRDAHVPVLFRPYHEMNGNWFWWGGRPGDKGSSALYRQMFDRFVNVHRLDNLIWVWNVNTPGGNSGPFADYFPGKEYVDVFSVDNYGEFKQVYYDDILALAGSKPIALGEVGGVPSPTVLKQQPKWTWFMTWSEFVEFATPLEQLQATFNAPTVVNRGDPRLAEGIAAMRRASGAPAPELTTPHATEQAKALFSRLQGASGRNVLSGQENTPQLLTAATDQVFQATKKYPAIYAQDLAVTKDANADIAAARRAIVDEAKRQYKNQSVVSLTWRAPRPTDDGATATAQSRLTDFEWEELLTPGTQLYQRWCAQVDTVAATLKELQDAGVPVLWRPYPDANDNKFWWAGRKGIRGSAALYRQLFERLVEKDGLRNLVWVWTAAPPGSGQGGNGALYDFFPGLLYVDSLAIDQDTVSPGWRVDALLSVFGVGKVVGLRLTRGVPDPSLFSSQTKWAWFLLSAENTETAATISSEALRKLYADPRIISRDGDTQGSAAGKN